MMSELVAVLAVFLGGCAALRALGLRGWGLVPLGLLAGVCLELGVGLVQVVSGLPTSPAITLSVTFALPVAWWVVRWRRGYGVGVSPGLAVACVAGVGAAVAALRAANMVKWHTDSLAYLMASRLLAEDDYRSTASTQLVTARTLGVPLLHAPAGLDGELYLRSITPLVAAATLAAVVWFLRRGTGSEAGGGGNARVVGFTTLAALLLVTNNRFIFSFFYLNGHLLFAATLLLVAASGWLLAIGDRAPADALMALQLVAVPALVITRPEGPVMGLLALLPTLLSDRVSRGYRSIALAVLGAATVLLCGFEVWVHLDRDLTVPSSVWGPLVLGVAMLLAVPLLGWTVLTRHATRILWLAEGALWLALLAFTLREPATLTSSVYATFRNLVAGAGAWGLSIVVLCGLLLWALFALRAPHQAYLRFPLTTFVPLAFLLAYLREGAYRVGSADSLNRMIMHVVPLAVLFLFTLVISEERDFPPHPRGLARLR